MFVPESRLCTVSSPRCRQPCPSLLDRHAHAHRTAALHHLRPGVLGARRHLDGPQEAVRGDGGTAAEVPAARELRWAPSLGHTAAPAAMGPDDPDGLHGTLGRYPARRGGAPQAPHPVWVLEPHAPPRTGLAGRIDNFPCIPQTITSQTVPPALEFRELDDFNPLQGAIPRSLLRERSVSGSF
jgi:hypothetical protein